MTHRSKNQGAVAWGKCVRGVLRRWGVQAKDVTLAVFGNSNRDYQSLLHQYLSGFRKPGQERVGAITRAIGSLTGSDSVRAYLDAEARIHGLLSPTDADRLCDAAAAFDLVGISVASALAFVRRIGLVKFRLVGADRTKAHTFVRRLDEKLDDLAPAKRVRLLDELHLAHRELLLDAGAGRVRCERGLETLRRCFSRHGIDFDDLNSRRRVGHASAGSPKRCAARCHRRSVRVAFSRFVGCGALRRTAGDRKGIHGLPGTASGFPCDPATGPRLFTQPFAGASSRKAPETRFATSATTQSRARFSA